MIKYFFILSVLAFHVSETLGCTTFFINHNGHLVFGRNYDWVSGSGSVNTNLRGLAKTSFPLENGKTVSWVSKFGSITFNQYGKEFPTGGMNEKGLVVELMWLDVTEYPAPDHRPAISVLQWIQYQLDNCETIDDVIATDKKLRIATVGTTPLHYLVADKRGNAATIEFLDGTMIVHRGKDLQIPVLTNSTYKESIAHLPKNLSREKSSGNSDGSSLGRFRKACAMVEQYHSAGTNVSPIDFSFDVLKQVAQGDFTKWSIVYDMSKSTIYFKTQSHTNIKYLNFDSVNFDCNATALAFDMNAPVKGDIRKRLEAFSPELNNNIIQKSFADSNDKISIPASYIEKIVSYSALIRCN
jgi:choloylglycine hydrolase